jgi:hypothetical protein
MIVYRDARARVRVRDALAALRPSREHGAIRQALIDFGILESGLADARLDDLRAAALTLGRIFYRSARGLDPGDFPRLDPSQLPESVEVGIPEGYAFYGLFPETYLDAAERFYREVRPAESVVIGIRSIGTSLSAAVAGAIAELGGRVHSFTVRPFGHPFDRRVRIDRGNWPDSAHFLIVDEGPGASGSSFGATAQALTEIGVPDSRIILFPSWEPDPESLINASARDHWTRHRRFVAQPVAMFHGWRDLSAGRWRELFYSASEAPLIHPQHERLKFLRDDVLAKFAGFGARGRKAFDRARALHAAGFSPRPLALENGFVFTQFVEGRPSPPPDDRVAAYLAFIRREFPSREPVDFDNLMLMIRTNVEPTPGLDADALSAFRAIIESTPAIILDGRMLAHEWIATSSEFLKIDAVDHGDDHFFPGPQDIAWDVAAAHIDLGLDPETYARASGDREIHRRLPFYLAAYSAFRLGYCRFFVRADPRFAGRADRYESILRRLLCQTPRPHVSA